MSPTTTIAVLVEFPPDIIQQYPVLGCPLRLENWIVFFDKLVKKGPLRAMAFVTGNAIAQAGSPPTGKYSMIASLRWGVYTKDISLHQVLH